MKTDFNIPKKNIICYLICLGTIIAFFIVYILPGINELKKKNEQIELLKSSIKKQETLFPFYEILEKENNNLNKYYILNSSKIEKCDTQELMFEIRKKCENNLIHIKDFKPEIKILDDNSEYLGFRIDIEGKLEDLHRVLKQIVMLSCIEHIEKIDVKKIAEESAPLTHKINLSFHVTDNNQMQAKGN